MAYCEDCFFFDQCASDGEAMSKICKNYLDVDFSELDTRFIRGEAYWFEVSYRRYVDGALDVEDEDESL